ncbi:MAG: LacI family DNA-binding transcriptional regulator [Bacteroidota bacterium]
MSQRVRIKDIALHAGVSKGTVDRVIHGRGNVSAEAKRRVLAAMEELHYEPNQMASILAYNKTWTIATLMPNFEQDHFWAQPHQGMEQAATMVRDYGVKVIHYFFDGEQPNDFSRAAQQILQTECDAVLVAPIFLQEAHAFFDACEAKSIWYGQVNTYIERNSPYALFYVGQDSYQSGVLAAKLLNFGLAEQETAMILHLEKSVINAAHLLEKEKGFEDYFSQHQTNDIHTNKASFTEVQDERQFQKFIEYTLSNHTSLRGIFVTTSRLFHLARQLERMNVRHLKLVGFDLIAENLHYLQAEQIDFLINQNPQRQGYTGILNLMNHLVFKKQSKAIQHLPLDVVMRENVAHYLEDVVDLQMKL